jgi:hypothetical protein
VKASGLLQANHLLAGGKEAIHHGEAEAATVISNGCLSLSSSVLNMRT